MIKIMDLIEEARGNIESAIEALRAARFAAEEIRNGINVSKFANRNMRVKLDRRSTLIEFNHAVLKAERTLANIVSPKRKKVPGRFARIDEFPIEKFESWNDEKFADDFLNMKISERLGK